MNDTLTKVTPEIEAEIESAVRCDVTEGLVFPGMVIAKRKCENEAKWFGRYPCCVRTTLACDKHHDSPDNWYCATCQKSHPPAALNWSPL